MKKAKSRLKKNRPSSEERAWVLSVILGSIVLNYIIYGSGLIANMLKEFNHIPEVQASKILIVETRERGYTEKQLIMDYIVEKFGDDANLAITMLTQCENHSLDKEAYNYNNNGTADSGVFQINSSNAPREEMIDWKKNVDMAYKLYQRRGNKFTDWTCATVIGQKNYLGR